MQSWVKKDARGFTLVEVLVAVCVFALGILALTRVQMAAVTANSFANEISQATSLAQEHMNNLLGRPVTFATAGDYKDCWLDRDNNGTAQDESNHNGIDGDDEGSAVDGVKGFGLNRTDQLAPNTADHSLPLVITKVGNTQFYVDWNIAIDQPVVGTRTARTIVRWQDKRKNWHSLSFDCVKSSSF